MARRQTLNTQIDKVFKLREELNKKQKALDKEKEKLDAMKDKLLQAMKEQGLENARGTVATVTVKTSLEPSVQDWDRFYAWMYRNKAGYMMFRRLNPKVYREALELRRNRAIPGVESYQRESLNILRRSDT